MVKSVLQWYISGTCGIGTGNWFLSSQCSLSFMYNFLSFKRTVSFLARLFLQLPQGSLYYKCKRLLHEYYTYSEHNFCVFEFTSFFPAPSCGKFPNMHLQSDLLHVLLCLQQGAPLVCLVVFVFVWDAAPRFYWYLCEPIRNTYSLLVTRNINDSGFIRNLSWLRPWGHLGPSECSMLIKSWPCLKRSIVHHFCFKILLCRFLNPHV